MDSRLKMLDGRPFTKVFYRVLRDDVQYKFTILISGVCSIVVCLILDTLKKETVREII
ncbi:hypothetical protein Patl1_22662 [Pistacia atlantica]|uniref:Uncharacterized protein n=1 Tax=Pistacia atlantica TaxID=434234 RepID=A0ACC0ZWT5_9ROSI|nr:hypothetical protein Patl1_22662 [Pistacia atlantica]